MLLARGGGGLSVAFDMPTLMGRDSDDRRSVGEVGHCGVAIDSAADMDILFDGIPLADTTTSMTISGPAVPVFCMYLAAAERQGADLGQAERHAADRHLQGVHRAEGVAVPAAAAPAADRRPDGVLRGAHPGLQAAVGVRLPHQGGRLHGRAGARVHARRRVRLRRARPVPRPGHRGVRARACRSSSTRTSTSSRRSPSSAPRAGSGPGGCATSTGRAPSGPSGCGSTPRPPGSR